MISIFPPSVRPPLASVRRAATTSSRTGFLTHSVPSYHRFALNSLGNQPLTTPGLIHPRLSRPDGRSSESFKGPLDGSSWTTNHLSQSLTDPGHA
ncbi:hypothetical protein CGCVW01_v012353 [Colletotrichum viniferum]|nr:hypothetical protein CGCVW01_v012353 [Colletotrichum viniferum]